MDNEASPGLSAADALSPGATALSPGAGLTAARRGLAGRLANFFGMFPPSKPQAAAHAAQSPGREHSLRQRLEGDIDEAPAAEAHRFRGASASTGAAAAPRAWGVGCTSTNGHVLLSRVEVGPSETESSCQRSRSHCASTSSQVLRVITGMGCIITRGEHVIRH